MIVQLFFFLAAVLVLTGFIPYADGLHVYLAGTHLLLGITVRFGDRHYPRWLLVVGSGVLIGLSLFVWSQMAEIEAPAVAAMVVVSMVFLALGLNAYASLMSAVAVALPACALIQLWAALGLEGDPAPGALLLLWTLALWPCYGLLAKGRLWAMASLLGVAGILSVMVVILQRVDGRALLLGDIMLTGWRYGDPLLGLGQLLLVVVSIVPLLLESTRFWRAVAIWGALGVGVPLLLISLAGPWPSGWPPVAYMVLLPAVVACLVGGIGLLVTVRRPDLLGTTAVRALALGVGASAVLLLPALFRPIAAEDLIPRMSMAVAPMVWGCGLAAFMAMAAAVATYRDIPMVDTQSIVRSKVRAVRHLRTSIGEYVSGIVASVSSGRRRWWSPEALVPLLFAISSYPSWPILAPWQSLVVLLLLPAVLLRHLVEQHLLLWSVLQAAMLGCAALLLGAPLLVAASLLAVGIASTWLFLRWSAVNAAWAYPGSLLLLVVVWLPWMEAGTEPVLVAAGLVVLVANAFLAGPIRWISLPLATLASLIFLWLWIPQLDRYVMVIFDERSTLAEIVDIGSRLPMAFLVLLVLLLNREEDRLLLPAFDDDTRKPMYVLTILVAIAWASGYRPGPWVGLILLVICIYAFKQSFRALPMIDRRCLRWPVLDGMAMMLASVLVAVGGASSTWQVKQQAGEALAGALGAHLLGAQHDVLAVLMAVGLVVLMHRWLDWYMLVERRLQRADSLGSMG